MLEVVAQAGDDEGEHLHIPKLLGHPHRDRQAVHRLWEIPEPNGARSGLGREKDSGSSRKDQKLGQTTAAKENQHPQVYLCDINSVEPVVVRIIKHARPHNQYEALQLVHWHLHARWNIQLCPQRFIQTAAAQL